MLSFLRQSLGALTVVILAAGSGLLAAVGLMALMGFDAGTVFQGLVLKSFLSDDHRLDVARIVTTLVRACPLILLGTAVALAFRCRVLNIGAEGQYLFGCVACAWLGVRMGTWDTWLLLPTVLLAGALAGAGWAMIAGLLKVYRGVSEVLSTILLNFIALHLVTLLVLGPLRDPDFPAGATTAHISPTACLPPIFSAESWDGLHWGVLVAALLAIAFSVVLHRTVFGFRVRAVGLNPVAARFSGIRVERYQLLTFALSGALAGLAGAMQVSGVTTYLTKSPGSDYGFTAIAVAMLARLEPAGTIATGLFFAMLDVGAQNLQRSSPAGDFPVQMVLVIQAVVILVTGVMMRWTRKSNDP